MKSIKNISIIGLGLIGGSLAIALKNAKKEIVITGFDRDPEAVNIALYRKIIDKAATDYRNAVSNADLVIIATPVRLIADIATEIKGHLKPDTIVTDVGSAKLNIVQKVSKILPSNIIFIGGHPMAGSENDGVLSARPDLFLNTYYILTPTDSTKTDALLILHNLFTKIGAKVITVSPSEHDKIVSLISHLPHVLSTNLVELVEYKQKSIKNLFKLCAGGFRDMTRIAASNPKMWVDISIENKEELINSINDYIELLNKFKNSLVSNNEDYIKEHYDRAKVARLNLPKYIDKDISRLYEVRVEMTDVRGILSEITLAISSAGINIEDISIFHSTEILGRGILKILVHGENAGELSKEALKKLGHEASVRKVTGDNE